MLSREADMFGRKFTHFVGWIAMLLLGWTVIALMVP